MFFINRLRQEPIDSKATCHRPYYNFDLVLSQLGSNFVPVELFTVNKTKKAQETRWFSKLLKVPARGLQQLVSLLENNAISEIGEAESEALAAFLGPVRRFV